ncbi:diguanylate cyclase [Sulfurimonas sp.]|uniref:sensor domain-containing diguanylate cyclase n=1 Tax=Sulfurimonas sp. TaxID=2022749 RepID=UPI0019E16180|nr:diguanylate cyclase [Sulfurimonas sp.]MBE0515474.1 diguanylate cyclase [Sulfurimonas sp.]
MISLAKKYTVPLILFSLVVGIAYLSYYNYKTQKDLLLRQLHDNSLNVASSVSSAIERFHNIKSTISLEKLVDDVSFRLEIFEFRYLGPDGTIRNSMFKEEIGEVLSSKSFLETTRGKRKLNTFSFEIRDFVEVMSIYHPIYLNEKLVGIIDLAVDISEYNLQNGSQDNFSILRRQVDIQNLLKSMDGSITNSLAILTKTNINDFLHAYIESAKNIVEVSIIDPQENIYASSNNRLVATKLKNRNLPDSSMIEIEGKLRYRTIIDSHEHDKNEKMKLMLLIDATTFLNHENRLFTTATVTAAIALLFALFTSRLIYFSALEQSRGEKERLEHLVKVRTREIELLSQTDSLTGLWNRRHLEESLESEFKRAKRYNKELSIMIIDLDHFKYINDTYGHMAGDEVLREVSAAIKECQRETDFIGRYGGEEIVIILPETDLHTSSNIAETVRETVESRPVEFEGEVINVTASIGISSLRKEHENFATLFSEADEALYNAKKLGRNRVEVF